MPIGKIDSKSFQIAQQANAFLRLSVPGGSGGGSSSPSSGRDSIDGADRAATELWRDLGGSQDAVSSYIICLITKLMSLDSGHGQRPLPDVYIDITEMQVDITKYKQWTGKEKQLPNNLKQAALGLQNAIIATIHFLKQFYGFTPSIQLRNIYLRWTLSRNNTSDAAYSLADQFESKMFQAFSVAASKDLIRDMVASLPGTTPSGKEEELMKELIMDCWLNHRRSFFGIPPPDQSSLSNYAATAQSLSYIRLKDLLLRNPQLISEAINLVCSLLQNEVSHSTDYGEREVLLPLLHILKQLITMSTQAADLDPKGVYRILMPFYTWPLAHSESTRKVMDMLQLETKMRGIAHRRALLANHSTGLKLKHYKSLPRSVVMLVDTARPTSYGARLSSAFQCHHSNPSPFELNRMILSNIFHTAPQDMEVNLSEIDTKINLLDKDTLWTCCEEALDATERAAGLDRKEAEKVLVSELGAIYSRIQSTTAPLEQRDSALSCNSLSNMSSSFHPMPAPPIIVYDIPGVHYTAVYELLRESIAREHLHHELASPLSSSTTVHQLQSENSRTSLDSTGSSGFELEDSFDTDLKSPRLNGRSEQWGGSEESNGVIPTTDSSRAQYKTLPRRLHISEPVSPEHFTDDMSIQSSSYDSTSRHDSPATGRSRTMSVVDRRPLDPHFLSLSSQRKGQRSPISLYSNQAAASSTATGPSGTGSVRVKHRRNPTATQSLRRSKKSSTITAAIVPHDRSRVKILKVVLAGDDNLVGNAARAFAQLRTQEPNLFLNLDVQFFHVPLTERTGQSNSKQQASTAGDLPEPANEKDGGDIGDDVLLGRYLAYMDSWYERNVMMAVHNTLRLVPYDLPIANGRPMSPSGVDDPQWLAPPTPSKVLVDLVSSYVEEARHMIRAKVFRVKMTLKNEKSNKGFDHRETFMLHKLDIQRLTGKKNSRQAKLFETSIALTELALDDSFIRGDMLHMKDMWLIRATNIPHPGDTGVPNPESECFELTVMKGQAEGGKFSSTKYRLAEENHFHVYELAVEAKDKLLSVIVDGEVSNITENVIRVEVAPAFIDQGLQSSMSSSNRGHERQERQLHFPLMTYWPVDL